MRRGHDEWAHRYFIRGRFDLVKQIIRNTANDAKKKNHIIRPSESRKSGPDLNPDTAANLSLALNHQNARMTGLFQTAVAPDESHVSQRLSCNPDANNQVNLSGESRTEYSGVSRLTCRTFHDRNDFNTTPNAATYHDDPARTSSGHYLVRSQPGHGLCFVPHSYLANLNVSGRGTASSFPSPDGQQQRGGENKAGPATSYITSAAVSPNLNASDDRRNWSYDQWVQLGK